MRILIISFYYPPDLCAGSFRASALVDGLQSVGGPDLWIDVLTTVPNRYQSHLATAADMEVVDGVRIERIALPSHQSGIIDQARAFSSFAAEVVRRTRGEKWDLALATSSRLMTAALGAFVARRVGAPLYLDIRDLFTDTMSDLLSGRVLAVTLPVFQLIEKYALRSASRINVVSEGFLPHARTVAPNATYRTFTNGIDAVFLEQGFTKPPRDARSLPLIVYAGNMGDGQGLHNVVPEVAGLLKGKARLRLIGDGGRRTQLSAAVESAGLENVELLPAVPRTELFEHYRQADILFMHLNDHAAFHKVLPSKLFEYAATGKPILAGVAGYAADFLRSHVSGVEVFPPCDAAAMAMAVGRLLEARDSGDRAAFCARFARETIMRDMARDILSVAC